MKIENVRLLAKYNSEAWQFAQELNRDMFDEVVGKIYELGSTDNLVGTSLKRPSHKVKGT